MFLYAHLLVFMVENTILYILFLFIREGLVGDWFVFLICGAIIFLGMTYVEENLFLHGFLEETWLYFIIFGLHLLLFLFGWRLFVDALVKKTYVVAFLTLRIKGGTWA